MSDKRRNEWSREELILAINLYCKTPFGRIHYHNPEIIELAGLIGRTPGAVSYKLANFASIDPSIDRKGASNVSKLDKQVWNEFFNNWDEMIFESETKMTKLTKGEELLLSPDIFEIKEGKMRESVVKTRVNQSFFRQMVLASYESSCCITGLSIPELLVASHISPWAVDSKNRLNPCNGLCLNALHDRAFDTGLITIDDELRVVVSNRVHRSKSPDGLKEFLFNYAGKNIRLPSRFLPDHQFLSLHRQNVFRNN